MINIVPNLNPIWWLQEQNIEDGDIFQPYEILGGHSLATFSDWKSSEVLVPNLLHQFLLDDEREKLFYSLGLIRDPFELSEDVSLSSVI